MNLNNQAMFVGHLGRDPEVHRLESGRVLCTFSIATDASYKNQSGEWVDVTVWHDVKCFGKLAEVMYEKLCKGMLVQLAGEIRYTEYEDQNGSKQRRAYLLADTFRNRTPRRDNTNLPDDPYERPAPAEPSISPPEDDGSPPVDDDLPF